MRYRFLLLLCCLIGAGGLCAQDSRVASAAVDTLGAFTAHVQDADSGMELPFANVYVAEGVGTLTNLDGDFTIKTLPTARLRISYVGYETITVTAGSMPKVLKMKPMSHALTEVYVVPIDRILKRVESKLASDHKRRGSRKSVFFYRQLTSSRNKELAEAFIEAKDAVNLRDMVSLAGRHGRQTAAGLGRALIANMNFHHPLELGPMAEDARFWISAVRPFYASRNDRVYLAGKYDYELDILADSLGKKIHAITFTPRESVKGLVALTGTIYVDAETSELLSFDGKVEGMALDVSKDFVRATTPISLDLHIKYRHTKKYTEVENISYTQQSGDLTSHALLFNVDGMTIDNDKKKAKKRQRMSENMLSGLDTAEFDKILAQNAGIVQRTVDESETAESEVEDVMSTRYNAKGNVAPMKWELNLPETSLGNLANRLAKFGQVLPQEKVYVHMDNTSYFIGDSIWFSAYLRKTSDDQISNISGVLYVELLNQDGYLMERKLIDTKDGRGHGSFYLNPDWYSGYYELRAYTRWQLNWGVFEREHSRECQYWFINKEMERRYFRDYEKLYSRVFPVYDAPKREGVYNENMTLRELMRPTADKEPKLQLSLYPEGGDLIEGVPCRVAFEAAYSDGRLCEGEMTLDLGRKSEPLKAVTVSRGRGVFEYTPERGRGKSVDFKSLGGVKASARLPKAERDGVALRISRADSVWVVRAVVAGTARAEELGLTIMHEGRVRYFHELKDSVAEFTIDDATLECGVNQATVFDASGRVYADRLFFVTRPELSVPSLTVSGLKDSYEPYERVTLDVSMNKAVTAGAGASSAKASSAKAGTASISLSVRDSETSNYLFDNASIQAEMLLSSEIQGFVPSPDWFFEKDDAVHREALDLLMMTQGWRRFNWRHMAVRGEWDLTQPDERTPVIVGNLYTYYPGYFYHPIDISRYAAPEEVDAEDERENGWRDLDGWGRERIDNPLGGVSTQEFVLLEKERMAANRETEDNNARDLSERLETERRSGSKVKNSVVVHAELVPIGSMDGVVVETQAKNGQFRITLPKLTAPSVLFLAGSDVAKWKKGKSYEWVQKMPDEYDKRSYRAKDGEFSLRVDEPYPRYVKPYDYYQQRVSYTDDKLMGSRTLEDGTRQLAEVRVKARRKGFRSLNDTLPALIVDGYDAYNYALDAGMLSSGALHILRAYVGDYGLMKPYTNPEDGWGKDYRLHVILGADGVRRSLKDATLNTDSMDMRRNLLNDRRYNIHGFLMDKYQNLNFIDK